MKLQNRIIALTLSMLAFATSTFAMSFNNAEKLGTFSTKLGANGLMVNATGYSRYINGAGYLYGGDLKTGIIIRNGKTTITNSQYTNIITNPVSEGDNIYKVYSDNGSFTPYVIGGNVHGGLDIDLVANNGGKIVKYISGNTINQFVEKNYGYNMAVAAKIQDVKTAGKKIYVKIAPWKTPQNYAYIAFTWDDNTGWFSIGTN